MEENNFYPFGLKHKGYNNNVASGNIALKRKFGGNEYQDEFGLNWYDVTARNYDPAIGRWMNIDPLAEQMRRWSPYNYAFNNPIFFIDPDGMMPFSYGEWTNNGDGSWSPDTELFDLNGNKIGEDENGKDGNVSIITRSEDKKRIKRNTKKGKLASQADVDSGVQTTKTVLAEALNVLQRTEDNGGLSEEASTVTGNGLITRSKTGSAESKFINGAEVKTSILKDPKSDGNTTGIHSHPTKIIQTPDGGVKFSSALIPGPGDVGKSQFKQQIIVGRLGTPTLTPASITQKSRLIKPTLGVAIFPSTIISNKSKPLAKLTKGAVNKIIE